MEIIDFNLLVEAIELNPSNEMRIEYNRYSESCGYWILKNVWRNFKKYIELSEKYPVFPPTESLDKNNPFFKQNLSPIQLYELQYRLIDLNKEFFKFHIGTDISNTTNVYPSEINLNCKYSSLIPHCDILEEDKDVLVSNIWVSDGYNGATRFWKYKDEYTVNNNLLEYFNTCEDLNKVVPYNNFSEKDGFVVVDESPAESGTISIYNGNQIHSAWIPPNLNHTRLSHVISIK